MKISYLMCFRALAQYKSFSEAANRIFISQSALSKQIKTLETELGGSLFVRDYKYVSMTPLGFALASHIYTILDEYESIMRIAHDNSTILGKKLRLSSFYNMGQCGVTSAIVAYERNTINFHIETVECDHITMINRLTSEQTDICIGFAELWDCDERCVVVPLKYEELTLITNKDHALAEFDSITIGNARGELFCFPREDEPMFDFFTSVCRTHGFTPPLTQSIVRLDTIQQYIRAGMRCTLQLREIANAYFSDSDFKIVGISDAPGLTLAVCYMKNKLSYFGEALVNHLIACYADQRPVIQYR